VIWFSLWFLSKTFLILRRIQLEIVINENTPSCKVPVILVTFWWNLNFLNRFSKKSQISSFSKIRLVGAELFLADRRTDVVKLTFPFCNFANASKNPSCGSWVVPYGRTSKLDEDTEIMQLVETFRNFSKAPKMSSYLCILQRRQWKEWWLFYTELTGRGEEVCFLHGTDWMPQCNSG
jgi:hypothetical protein